MVNAGDEICYSAKFVYETCGLLVIVFQGLNHGESGVICALEVREYF